MSGEVKYSTCCAKSALSKSKIADYTVNPYIGCEHACTYCYARFMKRVLNIREPWGSFVYAKINAPEILRLEVRRKRRGGVWISGVCDPYQPAEGRFQLTRRCLEVLLEAGWPVEVQTKSPLVLRDIDLLKRFAGAEVGFSIATADEQVRRWFEPRAPPVESRISALAKLRSAGIKTFVMIAPMLPGAEKLVDLIADKAGYVLVDKMNYSYAQWVYRKHGLEYASTPAFFANTSKKIAERCEELGIQHRILF